MKKLFITAVSIFTLAISVWAEENQETSDPKDLTQARTAFQNQMKAATSPVIQKYLQTLDTMKKQLGGKGDIAGATAVQKEIDSLKNDAKEDKTSDKKFKISDFVGEYDVLGANGFKASFTINKDNTCKTSEGYSGKIKIEGNELVFLHNNGWCWRIIMCRENELTAKSISPDKKQEIPLKLTKKLADIPDIKFK